MKVYVLAALIVASTAAFAQQSASPTPRGAKVFRLDGGNVTYAFGVNARGELQQIYWGGRLGAADVVPAPTPLRAWASFDASYSNTPQEYAGWGAGLFVEPSLKVTFADGNRDLVLHYASYAQHDNQFDVALKDISRQVVVTLHYRIDPATGILARSATIENDEAAAVTIEQAAAAAYALPRAHYRLNYLTGRWAGEWTLTQEALSPGARVLESRRGSTGNQANPWFAIQTDSGSEDAGETWFGVLAWSGSWRITIKQDQLDAVRITGGFNPFDFGYVLKPGEHLDTPIFYAGYSAQGLGGASRLLHRFELHNILPRTASTAHAPTPKLRPIIYNSWEAPR